jgi:hypothetical protein
LYGIGGAPYSGTDTGAISVDATILATQGKVIERRYSYQQWVATAKSMKINVCLYETGVDLNGAINGNAAGSDPRMQQIVQDVMTDPVKYGVTLANFYTDSAGDNGSGFPLRLRFESDASNCPKLAGMLQALASNVPSLSTDWTEPVQPLDYVLPDYTRSGYALYSPEMQLSYSIPSVRNIIIAGGNFPVGFKPMYIFVRYVNTSGNYSLIWQLGANTQNLQFKLFVDDVENTERIQANYFASVDATPCTDTAPVTLNLEKGWHVFKVQSVNPTGARVGARQFKLNLIN